MINTIEKTGIPTKKKGDGLSSADVNALNGTINNCVDAINPMLKSTFNLNAETGNFDRSYTKEEAIVEVPKTRRVKGLKIKFLDIRNTFSEFIFFGESVDDVEWENPDNWGISGGIVIDGGDW
jgi:hypothetical protein